MTKDFCDWVASLGGESNNVEESTITSLFASGYETKPALSVPIHVVELTNVPPELRMSATVSQEETPTKTLEQVEKTQKQLVSPDECVVMVSLIFDNYLENQQESILAKTLVMEFFVENWSTQA